MKSKKELIILGVIIVVLAAYLFFQENADRTHYELPALPALEENDITALEVTTGDKTLELRKRDDVWYVEPGRFKADESRVKPMIDAIRNLTLTALVSEAGNDSRYDLDDEKRIRVRALSNDRELRVLDIGKTAPSHQHTFVKIADDNRVYHARENFRSRFEPSRSDLMDKTVLTVTRDNVKQISIARPDATPVMLSLVQKPAEHPQEPANAETPAEAAAPAPELVWQDAGGNPVPESDINTLLSTVSDLKCREFIEDRSKESYTSPLITVIVNDGVERVLTIFEKHDPEDAAYPAISSENDHPFLLSQFTAEEIINLLMDEAQPEEAP
jgi:hypothetical protein